MASKLDDGDEPITQINVTPFVDIILVVLIIFMVTTPLIMKPSLEVDLPSAANATATEPSDVNIAMGADGNLSLNGEILSEALLLEKVRALVSGSAATSSSDSGVSPNPAHIHKKITAVLAADKNLSHGRVIGLIDLLKSAGIESFALSLDSSDPGER